MEPEEDTIFDENNLDEKDNLADINFEIIETGRWLLKVIGGPNKGAEFAMHASTSYLIGTDPNSCDIVFHDTSVSRQHSRIFVSPEDTLSIEDLNSRNGTLLDGEPLKQKQSLPPNNVVTMGTTSFIVYDRESEMQTIISPFLPSIVKVLQNNEVAVSEAPIPQVMLPPEKKPLDVLPPTHSGNVGRFVFISILFALVAIIGISVTTLFKSDPVVITEQVDYDKVLTKVMTNFNSIKWSYNKTNGRLFLVGHLLSATDKSQLVNNLQGVKFVKSYDDNGVVIDEYVWQDINQLLSNNPIWRGITVQAPSPGHFILAGYLQTRKQAEQLSQFMSENFRYLDLLEKKVVVDEDVLAQVSADLQSLDIRNFAMQLSNGELVLSGGVTANQLADLAKLLTEVRSIPGVRILRNYITELPPEASLINISDKYTVTGYSHTANHNLNVVINGRILSQHDVLDGMIITSINSNTILLEKDGIKYQINYNK